MTIPNPLHDDTPAAGVHDWPTFGHVTIDDILHHLPSLQKVTAADVAAFTALRETPQGEVHGLTRLADAGVLFYDPGVRAYRTAVELADTTYSRVRQGFLSETGGLFGDLDAVTGGTESRVRLITEISPATGRTKLRLCGLSGDGRELWTREAIAAASDRA